MSVATNVLNKEQLHELLTENWLDGVVYAVFCMQQSGIVTRRNSTLFLKNIKYIDSDGKNFVTVGHRAIAKFDDLFKDRNNA